MIDYDRYAYLILKWVAIASTTEDDFITSVVFLMDDIESKFYDHEVPSNPLVRELNRQLGEAQREFFPNGEKLRYAHPDWPFVEDDPDDHDPNPDPGELDELFEDDWRDDCRDD